MCRRMSALAARVAESGVERPAGEAGRREPNESGMRNTLGRTALLIVYNERRSECNMKIGKNNSPRASIWFG